MKKEQLFEVLGDIDESHIHEARKPAKAKVRLVWVKWAAAAACLCLVVFSGMILTQPSNKQPNPDPVQVANPIMEVASVEEMENYLDFEIPVLEKDVSAYIVYVIDGYPDMGRICYADGSDFRMKYGSGDISGIYGGVLEETVDIQGVKVSIYTLDSVYFVRYAIWEHEGFTFSLAGSENLEQEVAALIALS